MYNKYREREYKSQVHYYNSKSRNGLRYAKFTLGELQREILPGKIAIHCELPSFIGLGVLFDRIATEAQITFTQKDYHLLSSNCQDWVETAIEISHAYRPVYEIDNMKTNVIMRIPPDIMRQLRQNESRIRRFY